MTVPLLAGRYRLEERLGAGGYGQVYRATQLPLGREVAVKLVGSLGEDVTARFAKEAALAQRLAHPNTVRLLDFGYGEDGSPYLVWELLRGESLAALIARVGPLPLSQVLLAASQLLKSLMEAHSLSIVHRDIKPANLFVSSHAGEPFFLKVLDFGVAKDGAEYAAGRVNPTGVTQFDAPSATRVGQIVGTPAYMSPEQARGEPVVPSSDLYSVGLVLAEMLTGKMVFTGPSALGVIDAHASPHPVPLPAAALASPLGPVIERATQKELRARYGSAGEMLEDVERVAANLAIASSGARPAISGVGGVDWRPGFSAPPPGPVHPSSAPHPSFAPLPAPLPAVPAQPKQNRARIVAALLVALLGVSALLGWRIFHGPRRAQSSVMAGDSEETEAGSDGDWPTKVDFSRRVAKTFEVDEVERILTREGYSVKRQDYAPPNAMLVTQSLVVQGRFCGGSVSVMRYSNQANAESAERSLRANTRARTFREEGDVLSVALASADRGVHSDTACTNRAATFLSRPAN